MRNRWIQAGMTASLAFAAAAWIGCSEDIYIGSKKDNAPPEVWLSSGPVEGDTTNYQVHFYWGGWDPDGAIDHFEFVVTDGQATGIGFNPEDTTGLDKWHRTVAFDSTLRVTADSEPDSVIFGSNYFTRYQRTHTFWIRSVDTEGMRSLPSYRSFTAWTLAPYVRITEPRPPATTSTATLGRVIRFAWEGSDPIDDPSNVQAPDSVRYLYIKHDPRFDLVADLNRHPENYENSWSAWVSYRAPEDSGRSVTLGLFEVLELNAFYTFAVQAKDEAGAVTAIFDRRSNVRQFWVSKKAGALLTVCEPFLGCFQFLGLGSRVEKIDLPPGVPLNFSWSADCSWYGGEIACYRYGWDVTDVNDDAAWESACEPNLRRAPAKLLYSSVHRLYVEARDNSNTRTIGIIEINVVDFTMDRSLLWIDDFFSTEFVQENWALPTETQHDVFWTELCMKAVGFDTLQDVYDANYDHNLKAPEIRTISRYKNILWTYSPAQNIWSNVVYFMPESQVTPGAKRAVNFLSIFLQKGGHIITEGRSDRGGGIAATLGGEAQRFPMNLRCEITGNKEGCEGDTSGVNSMGYKDYCITVLDKVMASFRTGATVPVRRVDQDAMRNAYLDAADTVAARFSGMPATLDLRSEVTAPGMYFDPRIRGYTYVEAYDPAYWLQLTSISSQACFHPLYRMNTRSSLSPLRQQPVALVLTKYQNVVPEIAGLAVAAPSFHFGFELWFFEPAQVETIVDVIFDQWGISAQ